MKKDFMYNYPISLICYKEAQKQVFGKTNVFIDSGYMVVFRKLDEKLRKYNFRAMDYALAVTLMYEDIAKYLELDHVPVKLYCSNKAFEKYKKIHTLDDNYYKNVDDSEILYSELIILREMVSRLLSDEDCTYSEIMDYLTEYVLDEDIKVLDTEVRHKIRLEALKIICEDYGVSTKVVDRNFDTDIDTLVNLCVESICVQSVKKGRNVR